MTTMLSLILAFMLSIGGSPAGCPGDTGIQAPIDNNRTLNHLSEDYNQKTASRAISKKVGETLSIQDLETVNSIRFSLFSIEKLRQVRYSDHKSYRFNSVDPVINKLEALYNPQAWNLYAYCNNNPITYYDPDGRDTVCSTGNLLITLDRTVGRDYAVNYAGEMALGYTETIATELVAAKVISWAVKGVKWLKRLLKARKLLRAPKWVKDARSFVSWMKNIEKSGKTVSKALADKIVKKARKFGVKVRLDKPHIGDKKWNVPHLNIGKKGQAHVRVPKGYKLPD
jgi:RHS repeat-associated protein